jgi:hypothetical protein
MKIQAKCDTCSRTFLLSQIGPDSDAPGRCPFCGAHFARHYTSLLVDAVEEAEMTASQFVHSLGRLRAMNAGFTVEMDGWLKQISEQIRDAEPAASA